MREFKIGDVVEAKPRGCYRGVRGVVDMVGTFCGAKDGSIRVLPDNRSLSTEKNLRSPAILYVGASEWHQGRDLTKVSPLMLLAEVAEDSESC